MNVFQQVGESTHVLSCLIEHFQAGGEMVAAQLPRRPPGHAEKKLAAAVLASTLVHVRDHYGDATHRRAVQKDLEGILSTRSAADPFIPLCHVLDLEPEWVRRMVRRWMVSSGRRVRQSSVHRSAA